MSGRRFIPGLVSAWLPLPPLARSASYHGTPFLSKLKPGEIRIETAENERLIYYVSGGYLEVKNSTVTVLADQMLRSTEIDRNAAESAKAKAEQLLKTSPIDSVRDVAKLELVRALAQLRVLEHIEMTKLNGKRR